MKRLRLLSLLWLSLSLCPGAPGQEGSGSGILIAGYGWPLCLTSPQLCPDWKPSPYDPDLLLIPSRGANTVALHYVVTAVDRFGSSRLFIGDFPANAGVNGADNSVVFYGGWLQSASVLVTEIQGPDAAGNISAPLVYEERVI